MRGRVSVGLSGWSYPKWQGDFYPIDLPARSRLAYAAAHFDTLEINATFYSLQRMTSYRNWYQSTPDGFSFAVKGGRFITHYKKLRDIDQGLANFFASGPLALREKLGPVLWQLPARLAFDAETIHEFFDRLPRTLMEAAELGSQHDTRVRGGIDLEVVDDRPLRHALEVRHESFDDDRFRDLASAFGVACVVSDSPTWPLFDEQTTDFAYVRLHGDTQLYASGYSPAALHQWASRIAGWAETGPVFVYFDNDINGHAPRDALSLQDRLDHLHRRCGSATGTNERIAL